MSARPLPRGPYLVTAPSADLADIVAEALAGGVRMVQYRDKSADHGRRRREAGRLRTLCHAAGAPLLINDDIDLALEIAADGVHIGQSDESYDSARARLGASAIIGVTCHDDLALARAAAGQGADYVAFGRFFPSTSKPGARAASPAILDKACRELDIPCVAIGGITPANGRGLVVAGAHMLAVINAIMAAADPRAAAAACARLFEVP